MSRERREIGLANSLWGAATERQSLILAFAGLALAIVSHLVTRDQTVPLWVLWYSLIALSVAVWVVLAALKTALDKASSILPAVRAVVADSSDKDRPILLLEHSALFGTAAMVSIYHRDVPTGYEVLVAHGTVRTVQSDQKIQVKVDEWMPGNAPLVDAIRSGQGQILPQIIVRPSVSRDQTPHITFGTEIFRAILESRRENHWRELDDDQITGKNDE